MEDDNINFLPLAVVEPEPLIYIRPIRHSRETRHLKWVVSQLRDGFHLEWTFEDLIECVMPQPPTCFAMVATLSLALGS